MCFSALNTQYILSLFQLTDKDLCNSFKEQVFNARKKLLYAERLSIEKLLSEGVLSEEREPEKTPWSWNR